VRRVEDVLAATNARAERWREDVPWPLAVK